MRSIVTLIDIIGTQVCDIQMTAKNLWSLNQPQDYDQYHNPISSHIKYTKNKIGSVTQLLSEKYFVILYIVFYIYFAGRAKIFHFVGVGKLMRFIDFK